MKNIMSESELKDDQEEKNKIPFFWQDNWKNQNPSVFIKSWVILVLLIPTTPLAIVCLYYGIDHAITGSMAAILAAILIPIGTGFTLAVVFVLIPALFILITIEKRSRETSD